MAEARERRRRRIEDAGARIGRRRLSVRTRILVSILAVTALGLAASGAASYFVQRERALSAVDEQLLHTVPELKAVAAGDGAGPLTSIDAVLRAAMQQLVPATNESVLGIVDGTPALVPAARLPYRLDDDPALIKRFVAEADTTHVVRGTAQSKLGTLRYLLVPVIVAGDPSRGLYVAAYNLDETLEDVAQASRIYGLVALIALALIGLVAWFVAGRLLRPIRLLRQAAAANTAADLSERIPVTGHDDVSELTETINGMFDRLEDAFVSQRRLINDVGHELKTPLTIIRGHLELLDTTSNDDVDATRELAIDELDRMSDLVSEISLLAESRTPQFVHPEEVDVETLTAAVASKAAALDPDRNWRVESAAGGIALLDPHRITQAWLQLAGNAVKYSTPGAPIVIVTERVASRNGDWLHLGVQDAGPGIPEEAHERIFERFGRLESSRGTEGSGLGLSIVAAIAGAHGGSVGLLSSSGAGSRFEIRIPWRDDVQETDVNQNDENLKEGTAQQ
ncbi:ATP-binding protein [Parafrigoribacterium mesophilum]|uniref:sensor histidine kinase n=1 Tax=Parafrigoribacterium mesophilum TaxID=433646 RepID=UPI0031FD5AF2